MIYTNCIDTVGNSGTFKLQRYKTSNMHLTHMPLVEQSLCGTLFSLFPTTEV